MHPCQALKDACGLSFQVGIEHADSIHELRNRPNAKVADIALIICHLAFIIPEKAAAGFDETSI